MDIEYVVLRTTPATCIKREEFRKYVVNSESIPAPQILLVPETLEDHAHYLVELLVGLGSLLYNQHVHPVVRSQHPIEMVKRELVLYYRNCKEKGLL